jgi:hypothetical protein
MDPETLRAITEMVRAAAKHINADRDDKQPITFTVCRPVGRTNLRRRAA